MKYCFLGLSLLFTQLLLAQDGTKVTERLREFNNDTVNYIKQYLVSRKNLYVGKPLDSLLKDLPMIIGYSNDVIHRQKHLSPSTTFNFASYNQRVEKLYQRKNPLIITITWITPLDNREFSNQGIKLWGDQWNQAAYNYYKNRIVGNIETFKDDLQ